MRSAEKTTQGPFVVLSFRTEFGRLSFPTRRADASERLAPPRSRVRIPGAQGNILHVCRQT